LAGYKGLFSDYYATQTRLGPAPPPDPAAARPADAYVGAYANAYNGLAEIAAQGTGRVMRLGPRRTAFPLNHWDGDTFAYQTNGENASAREGVSFAAGRVLSVTVEDLDGTRSTGGSSQAGGPRAGAIRGGSAGSPMWVRIRRTVSVMKATMRMSAPQHEQTRGRGSIRRASSMAHR